MSRLRWGDHVTLLYSSIGRTYTVNALVNSATSRNTKHLSIALAR